ATRSRIFLRRSGSSASTGSPPTRPPTNRWSQWKATSRPPGSSRRSASCRASSASSDPSAAQRSVLYMSPPFAHQPARSASRGDRRKRRSSLRLGRTFEVEAHPLVDQPGDGGLVAERALVVERAQKEAVPAQD